MAAAVTETHVNSVFGPKGFTDTMDDHTVDLLLRLGLIAHVRDDHVVMRSTADGWVGDGPLHRFYAAPGVEC